MKYYKYILKFDNIDNSLSSEKGLPLQELAKLLNLLSKALNSDEIVLSDIISSSYAPEFTTTNPLILEQITSLHQSISEKNISGFNSSQKAYVKNLNELQNKGFSIEAKNKETGRSVQIEPVPVRAIGSYFQVSSIYGIITSIGGKTLDGKSAIHITEIPYDIEISNQQEIELLKYHKKAKILFVIRKEIDFETDKVKSAELEEYEIIDENYHSKDKVNFFERIKAFREKYADIDFEDKEID